MKNTPVTKFIREKNTVCIDTDVIITSTRARKKFGLVWGVVSAVFEIQTDDDGIVIPLVQRSKCTTNAGKWALLPSGGIDSVCELRYPNLAMDREIFEEVRLYQNCECVDPLDPLNFTRKDSKVIIHDEAVKRKFRADGEFFEWCHTLFLIATYQSKKKFTLDSFVVKDGEEKNGKLLHRDVALLDINSRLDCKVKPVARYKGGKRINDNSCIDLSGFQTPTLEYLRKRRESRLREKE